MCSVPGYDASGRIEDLATENDFPLISIAISSEEGSKEALKALGLAANSAHWVLLKNVHLDTKLLVELEKKLHGFTPNANSRIFLSIEISTKIPISLLRLGRAFVFEPPPGIKASL